MSYLIAFGVNNDFGLANKADNCLQQILRGSLGDSRGPLPLLLGLHLRPLLIRFTCPLARAPTLLTLNTLT